uniref:MORF/ORRM1/DAG-like MORF domain-containing protein n=2 Tax=Cannabis sativa TaxID=3483 RepID=A0A803R0L1_CANSA
MEFANDPKTTEDEMVNSFVKTLAMVLGSEEEAMKKIYSVSTCTYTGFGALILEEFYIKLKSTLIFLHCDLFFLLLITSFNHLFFKRCYSGDKILSCVLILFLLFSLTLLVILVFHFI